ncbi:hypothetical protein CRG98_021257 [Punica granatum]|uniref:Uncharacterized protein n=1 Tax=Punica granatum TaxID=22663 RepID=A0A2I0JPW8_PUNGR|nr:hypothetical protein CRG98_021257 [Punica granatum]
MRGRSPKVGPKPDEGPEPDVRPKPNVVNAGPEPDDGPKPNAVNTCSIRNCKRCKCKGQCWGTAQGAARRHAINVKSPNSSKSRVIYLDSGYEERVGEVFESRVTRLNAWKDARVQRMHIRVCTDVGFAGRHAGACASAWLGTREASGTREGAQACAQGVRGRAGKRATGARLALVTRE